MMVNLLNSVKSVYYRVSHDVRVLVSFLQFLPKALPCDLNLSVVCFPSSREAASKRDDCGQTL